VLEIESIEVVNKRRTIRDFTNEEVPFAIIEKSLQAGLKAPSYNHLKQ
jgi:nitroreductase